MKKEDWADRLVRQRWESFNNSKLRTIFDNLGLKRGGDGFVLDADYGYICFRYYRANVEFRQYHNGKVFVLFGYDDNAGAWGGYMRKCEVKNTDIFKNPRWLSIIKQNGIKATPDVVMI